MSLTSANGKTEPAGAAPGSQSNTPALDYAHPNLGEKTWSVGTLTYTKASLVVLFCWLLWGDFAWSMKDRAVGPVFQVLLTQYHATNKTMALLTMVIPAAIGLVLGPIISFRSDRYRSRLGRRIPFLLLTTPVAAVAMAAIAFSPMLGNWTFGFFGNTVATTSVAATSVESSATQGSGSPLLDNYIILYFGLFWVVFEIATIAANSVFGAFVNDVVPQNFLGRFFGLFRAVSLIAGIIFNKWFLRQAEEHYLWLFVTISALYAVGFTLMCFKVKEGKYPPPEMLPPEKRNRSLPVRFNEAAKVYFKECYQKPYYLWLFFAFTIAGFTFNPVNMYSWPYAHSINVTIDDYGDYLALTYFISLIMAYPLGALADRFHPLRVGLIALFLYSIASVWGGFFATTPETFAIAFVAHGFLSGTFFTATASLGQRLYPRDRFAQFASAGGIVGSLFSMVTTYAFGAFLDITGSVYRYTFLTAAVFGFAGLLLLYIVYRKFMAMGGPEGYVAPE